MSNVVKPLGYRVLVQPDITEEVTEGGIILHQATVQAERHASTTAVIVDIGPRAWTGEEEGSRCEIGDHVLIRKYAGVRTEDDENSPLLVNDQDIIGRFEDE